MKGQAPTIPTNSATSASPTITILTRVRGRAVVAPPAGTLHAAGLYLRTDARGSGLRHPADSHLTDWLEEKGLRFDVVIDGTWMPMGST